MSLLQKEKVNIGIVGVGGYGQRITDAVLKTENLELVACYHPNKEKVDNYAKKYNCHAFYALEEMLKDDQINGVVIITPNHLHFNQIKLAIKYNKHIFVEKPITNRLSEAEDIIKECSKRGLKLMVGHNMRRDGAIRKIKKLIDNKKIGDIVSAEINISHPGGMKFTKDNWRFYGDKCPGGPLIMNGVHSADISNYLFGKAIRVVARVKNLHAPTEAEDTSMLLLELEDGAIVYICNNYNIPATYFIKIYGTSGVIKYDGYSRELSLRGKDIERMPAPTKNILYKKVDALIEQMKEFGDCILKNTIPETSGSEAYDALAIVDAAMISQKENEFIDIGKIN